MGSNPIHITKFNTRMMNPFVRKILYKSNSFKKYYGYQSKPWVKHFLGCTLIVQKWCMITVPIVSLIFPKFNRIALTYFHRGYGFEFNISPVIFFRWSWGRYSYATLDDKTKIWIKICKRSKPDFSKKNYRIELRIPEIFKPINYKI